MKVLFFCIIISFAISNVNAQNVGIGTTTPDAKAALDIKAIDKGVLLPRLGYAQRTGISNPPKGLMVYDTTYSTFYYYDGGRWLPFYQPNYDSATIDYSSNPLSSINLPNTIGSTTSLSGSSGYIYDNGGPAGNYLANSNSSVTISKNDTTVLIKISIEEMNAEIFYDSLFIIYGSDFLDANTLDTISLSGTTLGNYSFNNNVKILFKSNAVNNLSGFKIRWGRVAVNNTIPSQTPLYGWHFNNQKMAAMGGFPKYNNWHIDSVGQFSLSLRV